MFPARYDCQTLSKGDALGNIIGNGIFLHAKGISKLTVQPFLRLAEIAFISGSIMLFVLYTDFVAVMQTFYHLGIIENLSKAYISSQMADAIVFAVLIIVLLVRPTGILGKNIQEKV